MKIMTTTTTGTRPSNRSTRTPLPIEAYVVARADADTFVEHLDDNQRNLARAIVALIDRVATAERAASPCSVGSQATLDKERDIRDKALPGMLGRLTGINTGDPEQQCLLDAWQEIVFSSENVELREALRETPGESQGRTGAPQ